MTTKFDIAANPSLKQLVYEKLQQMIIRGELKPGERLTEEDLSQAMNISRAPIREALNMLERDGFTKIIPRKGAIVAEVSVKDSLDIWKCRLALEPFAAKEACRNIPKDKVAMALVHGRETYPFPVGTADRRFCGAVPLLSNPPAWISWQACPSAFRRPAGRFPAAMPSG